MELLQPKRMIVGNYQERFLSPCYEQLRGVFYALKEADKHGFSSRPALDVTKIEDSPSDQKAWLAGFFFNSAVHRTAWAADRLLELFCYLPTAPEQDMKLHEKGTVIQKLLSKAADRLRQPAFSGCIHVRTATTALGRADLWSDPVSASNYLSIIRERVNIQKHAFEGFPYIVRTSAPTGTWEQLSEAEKMEWVRKASIILGNMYHDLYHLYFDVPSVLHPPKSFKLARR